MSCRPRRVEAVQLFRKPALFRDRPRERGSRRRNVRLPGIELLEQRLTPSAILPGFNSDTLAPNDDDSTDAVPLGFNINFFGQQFSLAYVNNNGNVSFDAPSSTYTPFGLTATSREII